MHTAQSWTNKQLPATALPLLGQLQRPRGHGDGGPGLALMRACSIAGPNTTPMLPLADRSSLRETLCCSWSAVAERMQLEHSDLPSCCSGKLPT